MSEEIDETEIETDETSKPTGPKPLREQNSKLSREIAEEREARKKVEAELREFRVAKFLDTHGADAKLAKYVPADAVDSDGVLAWLQEDGDVFGWQPAEQDDTEGETQQQAARISRATLNAPSARTPAITPEAIKRMSPAEWEAFKTTLPVPQ